MVSSDFTAHKFAKAVEWLVAYNTRIGGEITEDCLRRTRARLAQGRELKSNDFYVLLRGAQLLTASETAALADQLGHAVRNNSNGIADVSAQFLLDFYPIAGVNLALECRLFSLVDIAPMDLSLPNVTSVQNLVEHLIASDKLPSFIDSLVGFKAKSSTITLLTDVLVVRDDAVGVIDAAMPSIVKLVDLHFSSTKLTLPELERLAAFYLENDSSWSTKLTDEERSLGVMLSWLIRKKIIIDDSFTALSHLLKERLALSEALRVLSAKSRERGEYWQTQLNRAGKVMPKSFGRAGLVGVAMWFRDYVVAEFGPTGNAAHIYRKEIFELEVLHSDNWKRLDLVATEIQLDGSKAGTIHHVGEWKRAATQVIDRLVGG